MTGMTGVTEGEHGPLLAASRVMGTTLLAFIALICR